jgi:DNA repair protein RecO (recombination protein O)
LIFRKYERGEADEMVVFLARDLGWLRGVAKNSRKSRVRFGGHLEPLSLVELVLRPRRKDDLVWIDDSHVSHGYLSLRTDIKRVSRASYLMELASLFQGEGHPEPAVFDFLADFLDRSDRGDTADLPFLFDKIRLLGLLGFTPNFHTCPSCGASIDLGAQALFSVGLGGACHAECLPDGEPELKLAPDTMAVVRRGMELDRGAAARLRLSPRGLHERAAALSAFVRHLRGREINSLLFLEEMGFRPGGPTRAGEGAEHGGVCPAPDECLSTQSFIAKACPHASGVIDRRVEPRTTQLQ